MYANALLNRYNDSRGRGKLIEPKTAGELLLIASMKVI
jgi:hypothetical protein